MISYEFFTSMDIDTTTIKITLSVARLVGMSRMFESVSLFVWSLTQKRMIPNCSNLAHGTLGYSMTWFLGFNVIGKWLGYSNTAWVRTA